MFETGMARDAFENRMVREVSENGIIRENLTFGELCYNIGITAVTPVWVSCL